jgi:hypothetical protein
MFFRAFNILSFFIRIGHFTNGFAFFSSLSSSIGIELRSFQVFEMANSTEIHLGNGPRNLWNIWTKSPHKGFFVIILKRTMQIIK